MTNTQIIYHHIGSNYEHKVTVAGHITTRDIEAHCHLLTGTKTRAFIPTDVGLDMCEEHTLEPWHTIVETKSTGRKRTTDTSANGLLLSFTVANQTGWPSQHAHIAYGKPGKGLFDKYIVSRTDGGPIDDDADYFVLRLDTDENARTAAMFYANSVREMSPALGNELIDRVESLSPLREFSFEIVVSGTVMARGKRDAWRMFEANRAQFIKDNLPSRYHRFCMNKIEEA